MAVAASNPTAAMSTVSYLLCLADSSRQGRWAKSWAARGRGPALRYKLDFDVDVISCQGDGRYVKIERTRETSGELVSFSVGIDGRGGGEVDVTFPVEAEEFRREVRDFLDSALPADWRGIGELDEQAATDFLVQWRRKLADARLIGISWPVEYGGRGLSVVERLVLSEELTLRGLPDGGPNDIHGVQMVGNTLLAWGTEEQKRYFLPRILSGEDVWCQGFSEPGAGSDLANISTRARLDGDEWVIDGQKIWTSAAQSAEWIFVLARTESGSSRHQGISFLLCPMDQPGVEVRPITMLSGAQEFNEVFFTGARTAQDMVVGPVGSGWKVAMTLLGFERGESLPALAIRFRRELDRLVSLGRDNGSIDNPVLRDRLARMIERVEVLRFVGYRISSKLMRGENPGTEASISKLMWSEYHADITELAVDMLGAESLVLTGRPPHAAFQIDDPGTPNSTASWVGEFLNARGELIAAGTSQVQRNIIAERVLGMPR